MLENRDVEAEGMQQGADAGPTKDEIIGGLQRELAAANNRALDYSVALTSLLTRMEAAAKAAKDAETAPADELPHAPGSAF